MRPEQRVTERAAVMAVNSTTTRSCPACAEEIKAAAKKCRFCGEWFNTPAKVGSADSTDTIAAPKSDRRSTDPHAIWSLLCALLGGGLLSIPAVLLGASSRRRITRSGGGLKGNGLAIAGMVIGGLQVALIGGVIIFASATGRFGSNDSAGVYVGPYVGPVVPEGRMEEEIQMTSNPLGVSSLSASKVGNTVVFDFVLEKPGWCGAGVRDARGGNSGETIRAFGGANRITVQLLGELTPFHFLHLTCSKDRSVASFLT